jgi:hypothetical protein
MAMGVAHRQAEHLRRVRLQRQAVNRELRLLGLHPQVEPGLPLQRLLRRLVR